MKVAPSQGTHFFQNLTAFQIGYFTINADAERDFIDWRWLSEQKPLKSKIFTRHFRFENPVVAKMNGHQNRGIIIKPDNN